MTASQRKPRQANGGEQLHAQLLGLKVLRFPVFFPPSLPSCFLSTSFFFRIVREIDSDQKRMCHNLTLIPCIMCVWGGRLDWMQLLPRPSKEDAGMICLSRTKGSPLAASCIYCPNTWDQPKTVKQCLCCLAVPLKPASSY